MPARKLVRPVTGLYWVHWMQNLPRLINIPASYNTIFLFHAVPVGGQYEVNQTGAVVWAGTNNGLGAGTNFVADLNSIKAAGRRVILTVGGARAQVFFSNRTRSNNFLASIATINSGWGGTSADPAFDGIDFNNFEMSAVNITEMIYVASQLKATYGANFQITAPPANFGRLPGGQAWGDRELLIAMQNAGVLDYVFPQIYDGEGQGLLSGLMAGLDFYIAALGQEVVGPGFGLNPGQGTFYWPTVQSIIDAWNHARNIYPLMPGAFNFSVEQEVPLGWAFGNQVAPHITATGYDGGPGGGDPGGGDPGGTEEITFINSSSARGYSATVQAPAVSGSAAGHRAIAFVTQNNTETTAAGPTFTPPNQSWTHVGTVNNGAYRTSVYERLLAGPLGAETWTAGQQHWLTVGIVVYDGIAPLGAPTANFQSNGQFVIAPAVSLAAGELALQYGHAAAGGPGNFDNQAVSRINESVGYTAEGGNVAHFRVVETADGALNDYTWSGAWWGVGLTLKLVPASTGGGPAYNPTALDAVISGATANLTWSASPGVTSYRIFRRDGSTGVAFNPAVDSPIAEVPASQLSYSDTGLFVGTYEWQVFGVTDA